MYVTLPRSTRERGEPWGSAVDLGKERLIQRTDGLVDPVVVRRSFHVCRELTSKARDQHYDLTLRIIVGSRRELAD